MSLVNCVRLPRACKKPAFSLDMYSHSNSPEGIRTGYNFMHIEDLQPHLGKDFKVREETQISHERAVKLNRALNSAEMLKQMKKIMPRHGKGGFTVEDTNKGSGLFSTGRVGKILAGEIVNFYCGVITASTQRPEQLTDKELRDNGLNTPIPSDRNCFADIYFNQGVQPERWTESGPKERVFCVINGWNDPKILECLSLKGDMAGNFANHSCTPNCELYEYSVYLRVEGILYKIELPCLRALCDLEGVCELTVGYGDCICKPGGAYNPQYKELLNQAEMAATMAESDRILAGVPRGVASKGCIQCGCTSCVTWGVHAFACTGLYMEENCVEQDPILRILGYPCHVDGDSSPRSSNSDSGFGGIGSPNSDFSGDSSDKSPRFGQSGVGVDNSESPGFGQSEVDNSESPGFGQSGVDNSESPGFGQSEVGVDNSESPEFGQKSPEFGQPEVDEVEMPRNDGVVSGMGNANKLGGCLMRKGYVPKPLSCRQILLGTDEQARKDRAYDLAQLRKHRKLLEGSASVHGLTGEAKQVHKNFIGAKAKNYAAAVTVAPQITLMNPNRVPRSPQAIPAVVLAVQFAPPRDQLSPGVSTARLSCSGSGSPMSDRPAYVAAQNLHLNDQDRMLVESEELFG